MPTSELLAPRGDQRLALVVKSSALTGIDVETGLGELLWSERGRSIWAAATDDTGTMVAVLSAPTDQPSRWRVDFVDIDDGRMERVAIGPRDGTPDAVPDAITAGTGGIAWIPGSQSVAVALPSGGMLQVYPDGSQVRLLRASDAKRPAAVAVSPSGQAVAFVDRSSEHDGNGILAGSMKAKPIDPIVVLPGDRSGNRSARELGWVGSSDRLMTIIDRTELGTPQGDLFYVDVTTARPALAWSSPSGGETASVDAFAVSPDGAVVAFLTNSNDRASTRPSSFWLMQIDGPAIERFDLPTSLRDTRLTFTSSGVVASGLLNAGDAESPLAAAFLLGALGEVGAIYVESVEATPVALPGGSPVASPVGSPAATPLASPVGAGSPVASTTEE
ncbi:MAG: hypothetical protein KC438_04420 [Thermomicrobiales bacterium]|nr:hypothetical protein [Thermomicrobiales bacterium]